jgi:hypothetical protein
MAVASRRIERGSTRLRTLALLTPGRNENQTATNYSPHDLRRDYHLRRDARREA